MKYYWLVASCFLAIASATQPQEKGSPRSAAQIPGRQSGSPEGSPQRSASGNSPSESKRSKAEGPSEESGPSRKRQRISSKSPGPASQRSPPRSQGSSTKNSDLAFSSSTDSSLMDDNLSTIRTKLRGKGKIWRKERDRLRGHPPDINAVHGGKITDEQKDEYLETNVSLEGNSPWNKAVSIAKGKNIYTYIDTTGGGRGFIELRGQGGLRREQVPPGNYQSFEALGVKIGGGIRRGGRLEKAECKVKVQGKAEFRIDNNMSDSSWSLSPDSRSSSTSSN